jgi:hypothetical protein
MSDELSRTVSVEPKEFDEITPTVYPKAIPVVRRQRLVRTGDWGTVVETKAGRQQFILRNNGRMEIQIDNPLGQPPRGRPANRP